jgi:Domain of unknown function (DUF5679)
VREIDGGACQRGDQAPRLSTKGRLGAALKRIGGRKEVEMAQYEAYCVKDKKKVQFEGEVVTLKNGRKAAKGKCPECGTTVMRILGKADLGAAS